MVRRAVTAGGNWRVLLTVTRTASVEYYLQSWHIDQRFASVPLCLLLRVGQRDLLGAGEVGDEVADFVGGEAVEEAFGHHREGRFLAGFDVGDGNDERLVGGLDGERLRSFFGDDALDDAAVGEAEDVDFVFAGDDAAGVEDVVEDVVEVVSLGAGELGGDLGPFAEELVAVAQFLAKTARPCERSADLRIIGSELGF